MGTAATRTPECASLRLPERHQDGPHINRVGLISVWGLESPHRLDGVHAEVGALSDLLVGQATSDERHDLGLARRQSSRSTRPVTRPSGARLVAADKITISPSTIRSR